MKYSTEKPIRPSRLDGATEAQLPLPTGIHEDQARDLLRVLMDGVPDAIMMLDSHGNVTTWNTGATRMKQYAADEIVGRHFSVFYSPEQIASGAPERALEIAARVGTFEDEGWRVRKDKTTFWASAIITAVRNPQGIPFGFSQNTLHLTILKTAQ